MYRPRSRTFSSVSENGEKMVRNSVHDPCLSQGVLTIPKKRYYVGQPDTEWNTAPLNTEPLDNTMDTESYNTESYNTESYNSYTTTPSCISSFLENILNDHSLKLSDDGLISTESTMDNLASSLMMSGRVTPTQLPLSSPVISGSSAGTPGSAYPSTLSPPPLEYGHPATTSPHRHRDQNKKKMFEMDPLSDEEAEKKRINAVNAKRNRDMKKRELMEAKHTIDQMKEVNQRCAHALRKTDRVIRELGQDVQMLKENLAQKDTELRQKNNDIRGKREEMALLKGHLDIIANSLENENPAKGLLVSLLKRLPASPDNTVPF